MTLPVMGEVYTGLMKSHTIVNADLIGDFRDSFADSKTNVKTDEDKKTLIGS